MPFSLSVNTRVNDFLKSSSFLVEDKYMKLEMMLNNGNLILLLKF